MNIISALKARRTIRRFRQDSVPLEILEECVRCARFAPSAGNMQPIEYIIVNDAAAVANVYSHTGWAAYLGKDGPPPEGKRPTAFVVISIKNELKNKWCQEDVGAAVLSLELCALAHGVATCWIGNISDMPSLGEALKIPDGYSIDCVVAFGYPAELSVAEDAGDDIKYYRDAEDTLHVPKRPFDKIVHYNSF